MNDAMQNARVELFEVSAKVTETVHAALAFQQVELLSKARRDVVLM